MLLFNEICRKMFNFFQQAGSPGISGIGDAGEYWIFVEASDIKGSVDYGSRPVFVDKKTGEARYMDWFNGHDWELHDAAKNVDVPKEYRPVYS